MNKKRQNPSIGSIGTFLLVPHEGGAELPVQLASKELGPVRAWSADDDTIYPNPQLYKWFWEWAEAQVSDKRMIYWGNWEKK